LKTFFALQLLEVSDFALSSTYISCWLLFSVIGEAKRQWQRQNSSYIILHKFDFFILLLFAFILFCFAIFNRDYSLSIQFLMIICLVAAGIVNLELMSLIGQLENLGKFSKSYIYQAMAQVISMIVLFPLIRYFKGFGFFVSFLMAAIFPLFLILADPSTKNLKLKFTFTKLKTSLGQEFLQLRNGFRNVLLIESSLAVSVVLILHRTLEAVAFNSYILILRMLIVYTAFSLVISPFYSLLHLKQDWVHMTESIRRTKKFYLVIVTIVFMVGLKPLLYYVSNGFFSLSSTTVFVASVSGVVGVVTAEVVQKAVSEPLLKARRNFLILSSMPFLFLVYWFGTNGCLNGIFVSNSIQILLYAAFLRRTQRDETR